MVSPYTSVDGKQPVQRVVVIDDEVYICALVGDILTDEGYDVTVARNGEEGLRAISEIQPNLVITDIMMPGMSGIDVIQRMRTIPEIAHTPVIVMSAGRQPTNLARDVLFVTKPFDIDVLVMKVQDLIGPPAES